jgi:hypothetical protein
MSCEDIKPNMYFWAELSGLVIYTYQLAKIWADTAFAYSIQKSKADGRFGYAFELDEPVPIENLTLIPNSSSSFAT